MTDELDLSCHIHYNDPRYPMIVVQGRFNYGMSINPQTGDVDPTRLCICGAWADDTCICDLGEDANEECHGF